VSAEVFPARENFSPPWLFVVLSRGGIAGIAWPFIVVWTVLFAWMGIAAFE